MVMPVTFGSELDSLYKYNDCLIFSKPVVPLTSTFDINAGEQRVVCKLTMLYKSYQAIYSYLPLRLSRRPHDPLIRLQWLWYDNAKQCKNLYAD